MKEPSTSCPLYTILLCSNVSFSWPKHRSCHGAAEAAHEFSQHLRLGLRYSSACGCPTRPGQSDPCKMTCHAMLSLPCFILNVLMMGQPLKKNFKCHRPSLDCQWRFKGYCNNFCKDAMGHRIHFGPVKLRIAWLTFVDYNITWLQLLYNIAIYSTKELEPINEHLLIRNDIPPW